MVFHVTKSGYSSSRLPRAYGRREDPEAEAEADELGAEVAEDDIDVSVKALREDAVERVDGVDGVDELDLDPEPDEPKGEPKLELDRDAELELEPEPERSRRRDMPGKRMEEGVVGLRSFFATATRFMSSTAAAGSSSA